MSKRKVIALVAHDRRKQDLLEWAIYNKSALSKYELVGTSGSAKVITNTTDLVVNSMGHGPDGGDISIANAILNGEIDKLIFFIDVRTPQGHEIEIQMLIRTAVIKNVPIALNRASADYMIKGLERLDI